MVVTAATGRGRRVAGPLVEIVDLGDVAVFDLVEVGDARLAGEVVAIEGGLVTAQLFEDTSGLAPGAAVSASGSPLAARLGPGLLGGVFDGILRPLEAGDPWLRPGTRASSGAADLPVPTRCCRGRPARTGFAARRGHRGGRRRRGRRGAPGVQGRLEWIRPEGDVGDDDVVATIDGHDVRVHHRWPVRVPRPARRRLDAAVPLVTGQRVLDLLYPIAKGSTVGGGGRLRHGQDRAAATGGQVVRRRRHRLRRAAASGATSWPTSSTSCRPSSDPRTGRRLVERTVIIANTSNMPVMAREASIYTGMTVAEHFRDQGLDAVLIADSTSRWAEALREFASRTGELPAEEGYPAGLGSALAAFYERAGRVETLAGTTGSVSVIAAVSPPGGDTTEPVSAHTQRFVRALWDLDRDLAYARHYPAVSWRASFSRDAAALASWHARQRRHRLAGPPGPRSSRCWPRPITSSPSASWSVQRHSPAGSASCSSPPGWCGRRCCSRARCPRTTPCAPRRRRRRWPKLSLPCTTAPSRWSPRAARRRSSRPPTSVRSSGPAPSSRRTTRPASANGATGILQALERSS